MAHEIIRSGAWPWTFARARIVGRVALWRRNLRTRRSLALLSDEMLRDVGLTEAEAGRETRKPF